MTELTSIKIELHPAAEVRKLSRETDTNLGLDPASCTTTSAPSISAPHTTVQLFPAVTLRQRYTAIELGALAGDAALRNNVEGRSIGHVAKDDSLETYEVKVEKNAVDTGTSDPSIVDPGAVYSRISNPTSKGTIALDEATSGDSVPRHLETSSEQTWKVYSYDSSFSDATSDSDSNQGVQVLPSSGAEVMMYAIFMH
ncbi:hypothetical protein RRG08_019873 [Elysia crispata]|uniref:Uncharacterized protein n=1 Tax=Elysia crispata TaxID=231223 RepID=A0AAE1DBR5_9GAST|nr:hypothetical protein RRG08_019873 [Elysia crispata]